MPSIGKQGYFLKHFVKHFIRLKYKAVTICRDQSSSRASAYIQNSRKLFLLITVVFRIKCVLMFSQKMSNSKFILSRLEAASFIKQMWH